MINNIIKLHILGVPMNKLGNWLMHANNSTYRKKMLLICFLIKARKPRNLPYILWRTVLRKSRSRGSSLSNSSNNYNNKEDSSWNASTVKLLNLLISFKWPIFCGHYWQVKCSTTGPH